MQHQQPAGEAAPTPRRGDGDRQDFRLVDSPPRHDEACEFAAKSRAIDQHAAVEQQPFELGLAPAALERHGVEAGERGAVAWGRFR